MMKIKKYDDKNLFITQKGEDVFEFNSSEELKHRCITDKTDVQLINEQKSTSSIERLMEVVVGIGNEIPL